MDIISIRCKWFHCYKKTPPCGRGFDGHFYELYDGDLGCLQAFGTLLDGEFNLLAFFEVPIAIRLNRGVMDEYVWAIILGDEPVTL